MQVSNSTGQSTDWRVGSNGGSGFGGFRPHRTGHLKAGEQAQVEVDAAASWLVEFLMRGSVVASAVASHPAAQIALEQHSEGYRVRVS